MTSRFFKAMAVIGTLTIAAGLGCSKAPEQYKPAPPPSPERDLSDLSNDGIRPQSIETQDSGYLPGELPKLTQEEIDRRVRVNTNAEILYNKGAANITFDTSFRQSYDILGEVANFDGSQFLYREGVVIYWREDQPRVPDSIIVITGYQGHISFPQEYGGSARVSQSFSNAFSTNIANPAQDPKAQKFLRDLYNHLEGQNVDCLAIRKCRLFLNEGSSFVVFELPSAYFLFGNNERRILVQISLTLNRESGNFRNPIDLLSGKVQPIKTSLGDGSRLAANNFDAAAQFGVGQTYEEIVKASGIDPEILADSYASYYVVRLGQGSEQLLLFDKTNPDSPRPLPTDKLASIVLYSKYTDPLKFAEKFIGVTQNTLGDFSFSALDEVTLDVNEPVIVSKEAQPVEIGQEQEKEPSLIQQWLNFTDVPAFLTTKAEYLQQNFKRQIGFMKGLFNYFQTEGLKKLGAPWVARSYVSGSFDTKFSPEITAATVFINPQTQEGRYVDVSLNETNGDLTFSTNEMVNPFEKKVYMAAFSDFTAGQRELAGFKLGERIFLANVKYARSETTSRGSTAAQVSVRYEDKKLGTIISSGSYVEETETSVVYETGLERNITNQPMEYVRVATADLGLNKIFDQTGKPAQVEINGVTWTEYEINVIETTSLLGQVNNLCGIPDFDINFRMHDEDFQSQFVAKPAAMKKQQEAARAFVKQKLAEGLADAEVQKMISAEQKAALSYSGCPGVAPASPLGTSTVREAYYFPNHQMKLIFSKRELSKIGIYQQPGTGE